ncbi:MAG: tRNA-uridine aminocarboxypropyltransferase [Bacteriovoracia bacterium]
MKPKTATPPIPVCATCEKPPELCFCAEITPHAPKTKVLILQHPQEPDKRLGTARLLQLSLKDSVLRVGLSWPNLGKALGSPAGAPINPKEWAVLYLGSGIKLEAGRRKPPPGTLTFVNKKSQPWPPTYDEAGIRAQLKGIVLLDGTWSQAKALWWRNAWLLKLNRAILTPPRRSLYGKLRKEPRPECLSTLETAAYALTALGDTAEHEAKLLAVFSRLLKLSQPTPKAAPEIPV